MPFSLKDLHSEIKYHFVIYILFGVTLTCTQTDEEKLLFNMVEKNNFY